MLIGFLTLRSPNPGKKSSLVSIVWPRGLKRVLVLTEGLSAAPSRSVFSCMMCLWFTGWQLWQCYWWCSALPSLGPEKPKVSAHLWGEGELLWVGEERELPLSMSRLHLLKNCDILFSHHQSLSHGAFIPSTRKGLWMPAFWMLLKVTPYTWDKSSQFSSGKTSLVLQPIPLRILRGLSRKDTLEEEMAIHSSILAWRIPWTEDPGELQSMVSQRVGHERAHTQHTYQKKENFLWKFTGTLVELERSLLGRYYVCP